jgi:hypothetical protein
MKPRKPDKSGSRTGVAFSGGIAVFSEAQKLACVSGLLKPAFEEYVKNKFTQVEVDEIVCETQNGILTEVEMQAKLIRELSPWVVAIILGRDGFSQIF